MFYTVEITWNGSKCFTSQLKKRKRTIHKCITNVIWLLLFPKVICTQISFPALLKPSLLSWYKQPSLPLGTFMGMCGGGGEGHINAETAVASLPLIGPLKPSSRKADLQNVELAHIPCCWVLLQLCCHPFYKPWFYSEPHSNLSISSIICIHFDLTLCRWIPFSL